MHEEEISRRKEQWEIKDHEQEVQDLLELWEKDLVTKWF